MIFVIALGLHGGGCVTHVPSSVELQPQVLSGVRQSGVSYPG